MRLRRWLVNPFSALRSHYQVTLDQVEQDLNAGALSLPSPAPWTRRLTQVILVGITVGVGWSIFARIDVVVVAQGKLETLSQSQAVQSRVGGVVTAVHVQDGDQVKQGQLLMQLDKTTIQNQLETLLIQQDQLVKEIAVLRIARQGAPMHTLEQSGAEIPPELMNRVQNRMVLAAQITSNPSGLSPEQQQRYQLFQQQLQDRLSISQLQSSTIETQIAEADAQLAGTEFQLQVQQELLDQFKPLMEEGAISRVNFLQRAIDVNALESQLNQGQLQKRQLQLNQMQSQVDNRQVVTQIYQELQNQLATIDAEFDRTIQNDQRELIEVNSQLNQAQIDLKNQDLRAPADGVVFDLGPKLPGAVAQPGQALLQIVPNESLIVRAQVANADIANIQEGMPVDVRIDAYPFTEYGAVTGVVTKVGSEATKMNDVPGQTAFPVEIRLDQQFLERGAKRFTLLPGMSLMANIKVRERAPISYVAQELIEAFDGMRSVR